MLVIGQWFRSPEYVDVLVQYCQGASDSLFVLVVVHPYCAVHSSTDGCYFSSHVPRAQLRFIKCLHVFCDHRGGHQYQCMLARGYLSTCLHGS